MEKVAFSEVESMVPNQVASIRNMGYSTPKVAYRHVDGVDLYFAVYQEGTNRTTSTIYRVYVNEGVGEWDVEEVLRETGQKSSNPNKEVHYRSYAGALHAAKQLASGKSPGALRRGRPPKERDLIGKQRFKATLYFEVECPEDVPEDVAHYNVKRLLRRQSGDFVVGLPTLSLVKLVNDLPKE